MAGLCNKCLKCGSHFATRDTLEQHSRFVNCAGENRSDESIAGQRAEPSNSVTQTEQPGGSTAGTVQASTSTTQRPKKHECKQCQASFTENRSLTRHMTDIHGGGKRAFVCSVCEKTFTRADNLQRHMQRIHNQSPESSNVGKRPISGSNASKAKKPRRETTPNDVTSTSHDASMDVAHTNEEVLINEQTSRGVEDVANVPMLVDDDQDMEQMRDADTTPLVAEGIQRYVSLTNDLQNIPDALVPDVPDITRVYRDEWAQIRSFHRRNNPVQNRYNFRLTDLLTLQDYAEIVFNDQGTSFKVNVAFGFILRNVETDALTYHYASQNTRLFQTPHAISSRADFVNLLEAFARQDPLEWSRAQRSSSKFIVELLTNVVFYVNRLSHILVGEPLDLPDYIKNNKGLYSLQKGTNGPYTDKKCLFRCLAIHLNGAYYRDCETRANEHLDTYLEKRGMEKSRFRGVPLQYIPDIEDLFGVNIHIYALFNTESQDIDSDSQDIDSDAQLSCDTQQSTGTQQSTDTQAQDVISARLVRRSMGTYDSTMYVNLHEAHFGYICNLQKYSAHYACCKCSKFCPNPSSLIRHERTCRDDVKLRFPGGMFHTKESIFESLEDVGIIVPEQDRHYPYRACYDFESYLVKATPDPARKTNITASHAPLSVSVNSNVPGFDSPKCFVSEGSDYVLVAQMMTYLNELSETSTTLLTTKFKYVFDEIEKRVELRNTKPLPVNTAGKPLKLYLEKLKADFLSNLAQMPVLRFNSAKYDLNVIKVPLYEYLSKHDNATHHIKKGTSHLVLATHRLKFLDIRNYLASDVSYEKWVNAYDCSISKGKFCYEYMDSLDKLLETELPPAEAFYDTLHDSHISTEDYNHLQSVWLENNMQTLRDFLIWYNNLDVTPFLEAVEKMFQFYLQKGLDMFKDALSVPGLTQLYLFKNTSHAFSLINRKDEDLYRTLKANIVGGPSIIFHRYHEKGVTRIRNEKPCQKILGFDANALYLYAIMSDMPTGNYTRRLADDGFKPKFAPSKLAHIWLEWEAQTTGVSIRHQGNNFEKRIGDRRIPVDGFVSGHQSVNQTSKGVCYQFMGCLWHCHKCHLTKQADGSHKFNNSRFKTREEGYAKTLEICDYIKSEGYDLVIKWECEFRKDLKENMALATFAKSMRRPLDHKVRLTEEQILAAVVEGKLYGFIEVDIKVPDHLKSKFAEFPPIFKNTEVSVDDIGDYMRDFAREHDIMKQPRRMLIGSMFGECILVGTPLLKWYLEQGLVVTHIYQVVEYTPAACFRQFGEIVSDARRAGDSDPKKKIIGETFKLLGNSAYGKTVTNKEKHTTVKICDKVKALKGINCSRFRSLNVVGDECFEVFSSPRSITLDLPLQIGVMVYQLAKLRMLQFYYDFFATFLDRSDYEMCEMDTDSAYFAVSGETLEDLIKPDMIDRFNREIKCLTIVHFSVWFPRDDSPETAKYDKRTPGLFKLQFSGDGMISLCSKSYYCFGGAGDKFSCKGVSRQSVQKDSYLAVLQTKQTQKGTNTGFRLFGNGMKSYTQIKDAFSYFYAKRKVLDDGVSTTYLDI